ncbi:MAG: flagellar biosynthesis anti-sigma factor FlgM [Thiomicrorhabdus sp.]|nr:flagellar biosynthesis anti-sigma factor FlgM [Thiomicrorhabdus sp.]
MDIKNVNNNVTLNRSNDSFKPSNKEDNDTSAKNTLANTDKVILTQTMTQMSSLEQAARSVSIDNSARITELKLAVQDGSYQVNAEKVADKLLQTEALFAKA